MLATLTQTNLTDYSGSSNDDDLVRMWLYGKARLTQEKYQRVWREFQGAIGLPLKSLTLADVHGWIAGLSGSPNTIKGKVHVIKSLLTFASQLGYISFNIGAVLKAERIPNKIAQKCLPGEVIKSIAAHASTERDRMIIRLGYLAGMRAAELSAITCNSLRGDTITFVGKGSKVRSVKLPQGFVTELAAFIADRPGDEFIFIGRQRNVNGGKLSPETITRIVKKAAIAAGESEKVSAHYLRHSHAYNALKAGANVALIRDTLGHASLATTSQYLAISPDDSSAMSLSI